MAFPLLFYHFFFSLSIFLGSALFFYSFQFRRYFCSRKRLFNGNVMRDVWQIRQSGGDDLAGLPLRSQQKQKAPRVVMLPLSKSFPSLRNIDIQWCAFRK